MRRFKHFRETRFLADRQLERNAILPKRAANLFHATEKIAVLLVEFADEHQPRLLHFVEHFPDAARANFDAAHAVDDDNGRIGGADGRQRIAEKVGEARRVKQGDRVALPLAVEGLGVDGHLAFEFVGQTIGGAGPVGDAAVSGHGLGDEQHGIDQGRFAAGSMADDGYGTNLRGVEWHFGESPENWFTFKTPPDSRGARLI